MNTVSYTREGNTLTIVVDLSGSGTPSASGKTLVLASSRGNMKIDGDELMGYPEVFVGLNVYRYPSRKAVR